MRGNKFCSYSVTFPWSRSVWSFCSLEMASQVTADIWDPTPVKHVSERCHSLWQIFLLTVCVTSFLITLRVVKVPSGLLINLTDSFNMAFSPNLIILLRNYLVWHIMELNTIHFKLDGEYCSMKVLLLKKKEPFDMLKLAGNSVGRH